MLRRRRHRPASMICSAFRGRERTGVPNRAATWGVNKQDDDCRFHPSPTPRRERFRPAVATDHFLSGLSSRLVQFRPCVPLHVATALKGTNASILRRAKSNRAEQVRAHMRDSVPEVSEVGAVNCNLGSARTTDLCSTQGVLVSSSLGALLSGRVSLGLLRSRSSSSARSSQP